MSWFKKKEEETPLEKEIARILNELAQTNPASEEYSKLTKHLQDLTEIDVNEKNASKKEKVSPNAVANGVIGLLEVAVIMTYEKSHVIVTKAFSRLMRGRA